MNDRVQELEELVRAKNQTIIDMYNNSLESAWSRRHSELQHSYEEKYGLDLEFEEGEGIGSN
jgi:hypothetical protein